MTGRAKSAKKPVTGARNKPTERPTKPAAVALAATAAPASTIAYPRHAPTAARKEALDEYVAKRLGEGVTQADIAKELGIGLATLKRWHAVPGVTHAARYSEERRSLTRRLAGIGCTNQQISTITGLTLDELTGTLQKELSEGRAEAGAQVKETLFQMATSGSQPHTTMFWLKAREGWRDREEAPAVQVAAAGPVEVRLGGRRLDVDEDGISRLVDDE